MDKIKISIEINAPAEKVWAVLLGKDSYPEWAAVFAEGSKAETDWQKGSKALFLDSNNEGMVSRIADNIPNEFMSIEHLGMIKDGKEDLNHEWSGAKENYNLSEKDGKTELLITMDSNAEMQAYFEETWPKALDKIKLLSENK
ncbi:SRPBCC family protein [Pedobacter paludis]|uniref:ATPase n=1 Tax=Pedobacter paludis TaxID=2203212 RepID=A0A317EY94_9SPHI|nr:SRPBCC domain-containing protein [Pedobacter paludis]PWS31545.1 ATPase [Pedobacter paludis]